VPTESAATSKDVVAGYLRSGLLPILIFNKPTYRCAAVGARPATVEDIFGGPIGLVESSMQRPFSPRFRAGKQTWLLHQALYKMPFHPVWQSAIRCPALLFGT